MESFYTPHRKFRIKSINTAFLRTCPSNYYYNGEMHDFWEMMYVSKGNFTILEDDRVYDITEGQVLFFRPMEFHRFWTKNNKGGEFLVISFTAGGKLIDCLGNGIFNLDISMREALYALFHDIQNAFNCGIFVTKNEINNSELDETLAMVKLEAFLLSAAATIHPDKQQPYTVSAANYKKIINVMKEHLYENLTVDRIASICCMGTSNLKKTFKMYAGCGVMHYLNQMKIIKAAELLKEGKSVSEISELLAFSSPNYFSAVFKRVTGLLPTQYRKNTK